MKKDIDIRIIKCVKGLFVDVAREGEMTCGMALQDDELLPLLIAIEDYMEAHEIER